jgi:hypothetical protein
MRPSTARSILVGLLLGWCAATSVAAGILLGVVALTFATLQVICDPDRRGTAQLIRFLIFASVAALGAFSMAIAPILIARPDAYRQYLAHAAVHIGNGNFLAMFFTGWAYEEFHRSVTLLCATVAAVGFIGAKTTSQRQRWLTLWAGPIFAIAIIAFLLPDKIYYLWMIGPWMAAAAAVTWQTTIGQVPWLASRAAILAIGVFYAIAIAPFVRESSRILALPASQRLAANADLIRASIPKTRRVLTDAYWWVLADDYSVFDRYFSRTRPSDLDFLILTGDGSGEPRRWSDVPNLPPDRLVQEFTVEINRINREPLRMFGREWPGSAVGFGPVILIHRERAEATRNGSEARQELLP